MSSTPLTELFPVLPNLQELTLRATVLMEMDRPNFSVAAKIINSFGSSLQHLILEIDISLTRVTSNLAEVDFSPLAVLGAAIPWIDLYVHTNILPSTVTLARLLSSLMDYDGIMRSIKEGKLVVHSEKTAPDYVEGRYYVLR